MYSVVLLTEQALTELDVRQVVSLHEGLDDTVEYHVLLPVDDAAAAMAASLGTLGGVDVVPVGDPEDVRHMQHLTEEAGADQLATTTAGLEAAGQQVTGHLTTDDPVRALEALVAEVKADEAIVLTQPHLVREFFGLDWAARAKRALDIPTLHLLEHETFDEQSGGGEGVGLI
ncbi:hypothetical protein [Solicola sp. PLA-1-18]|uniref:hypothetical protein n=1 Tax=Solicola sp. PLA-1-18 TaxID=3380532 RepID=UPI003B81141C